MNVGRFANESFRQRSVRNCVGVNSQTSDSSQTSYIASTLCYVQCLGDKSLTITKSTEDLDRNKNSDEGTFADKGVRLIAESLRIFFFLNCFYFDC